MGRQWGQPRHKGARHNRRVRGRDTWGAEDRRLKRHLHGRIWRKRGPPGTTWTGQVNKLDRHRPAGDRLVTGLLWAGGAVGALAAGGRVLLAFTIVALAAWAWHALRR